MLKLIRAVKLLLRLVDQFKLSAYEQGTFELTHHSGSRIRFEADGNVEYWAARNIAVHADRYISWGELPDEEKFDKLNRDRLLNQDPIAIQEIVHENRLPHLLTSPATDDLDLPAFLKRSA